MLSDDELVEQILLGNENAAEELIKRYYTSILRYCRWHCSNLEKAEDLYTALPLHSRLTMFYFRILQRKEPPLPQASLIQFFFS